MLIANGVSLPSTVWNQIDAVTPNAVYQFSFYLAEISAPSSSVNADIALNINGNQIGDSVAPLTQDVWQQVSFEWNSGPNGTAVISLSDLNPSGPGNDFAIDNISMSQVPEPSDFALLGLGLPLVAWFGRGKFQPSSR